MRTLRNLISALLCAALVAGAGANAGARATAALRVSPAVASLDAAARAEGNRKATAVAIGKALFGREWPAQVLKVYCDGIGRHEVAGLRISGEHFHRPLTAEAFEAEVADLVERSFAAAPVEEVDVLAVVPLAVVKGEDVSGDLAVPTSRTVFTVTVLRGERAAALHARMRAGRGVYLNQEWARTALK